MCKWKRWYYSVVKTVSVVEFVFVCPFAKLPQNNEDDDHDMEMHCAAAAQDALMKVPNRVVEEYTFYDDEV